MVGLLEFMPIAADCLSNVNSSTEPFEKGCLLDKSYWLGSESYLKKKTWSEIDMRKFELGESSLGFLRKASKASSGSEFAAILI